MAGRHLNPAAKKYNSDIVVDVMKALGIEYVALNPGSTFKGILDSIVNYGGNRQPEVILCCDEEIAVDVASGYARATGKPIAAMVHNVVGLLRASMAIFNAWVDRAPVLVMGGGGPADIDKRRHWMDWMHSSVDEGSVVRDYVKWDEQAGSLSVAVDALLRGYQVAAAEPQGPVYLCFDTAWQEEEAPMSFSTPDVKRYLAPSRIQSDPEALKRAVELLVEAKTPVVLADYLGREAGAVDALVELAELLSLPVIDCGDTFNFPNRNPLDLTGAEKEMLSQADVVLSLNISNLSWALSGFAREPGADLLPKKAKVVDISLRHFAVRSWVHDFGKLPPVDIAIAASPSLALPALTGLCREIIGRKSAHLANYRARRTRLKSKHDELHQGWLAQAERERDSKPISLSRLNSELWRVLKDEDWVLVHQGMNSWARKLWDWREPYQYLGTMMGGGLGYGLGVSLGAALANRPLNRLCVDIQPDGDFLFTAGGLWTAAHHHIPLLVVMYNNRSYCSTEGLLTALARQRNRSAAGASISTHIENPPVNYAALARSYGVHGEGPIEDPQDLRPALARAVKYVLTHKEPALIDVVTQPR